MFQGDDVEQVREVHVGPHQGCDQVHGEGQCNPRLTLSLFFFDLVNAVIVD